jgi:hypothetical protein
MGDLAANALFTEHRRRGVSELTELLIIIRLVTILKMLEKLMEVRRVF